jgi:CNT family concentrative nucleoside transporter
MERFTALIGFFAILAIAYLMSTDRKAIKWRPVFWGLLLQIVVAIFVLKGTQIANAIAPIAPPLERWGRR